MLRAALLVASAFATTNYTTLVFTHEGPYPDSKTWDAVVARYADVGLPVDLAHNQMMDTDTSFLLALGPKPPTTAEEVYNATVTCEMRGILESTILQGSAVTSVEMTYACINSEEDLACGEEDELKTICPSNSTEIAEDYVAATIIILVLVCVFIVIVIAVVCWKTKPWNFVRRTYNYQERSPYPRIPLTRYNSAYNSGV